MYDARSRSRFRLLVTALTGAATVGSLTAAGVATGAIARGAHDVDAAADPVDGGADAATAEPALAGTRAVRWQDRPRRTVVRRHRVLRVVPSVPEGTALPAPGDSLGGGTLTPLAPEGPAAAAGQPPPPASGSGGSAGSGGSGAGGAAHPAPQPPSQPVEPPPPAPPAPTPEPPVPSTGS